MMKRKPFKRLKPIERFMRKQRKLAAKRLRDAQMAAFFNDRLADVGAYEQR
jgi:hypothetical protein